MGSDIWPDGNWVAALGRWLANLQHSKHSHIGGEIASISLQRSDIYEAIQNEKWKDQTFYDRGNIIKEKFHSDFRNPSKSRRYSIEKNPVIMLLVISKFTDVNNNMSVLK